MGGRAMSRGPAALCAIAVSAFVGRAYAEGAEARLRVEAGPPIDEMPSVAGATGLVHTVSARTGPVGAVRSALMFEGFRAPFLCTKEQPCGGLGRAERATHVHTGLAVSIGTTLFAGVEVFLVGRASSNRSSGSRVAGLPDDVLEVIGDTTLGVKIVRPLSDGLHVGGALELLFGSGPGRVGLSLGATSARVRGLATYAFDEAGSRVPLRLHLGLGYLLDNTARLVEDVEAQRSLDARAPQQISRIERYGLGINKLDRAELEVSVEWLARARLRPFLEYGLAVPIDRRGAPCTNPAASPDPAFRPDVEDCGLSFGALPSRLTLGVRTSPFVGESGTISVLLGIDVGLTGTSRFVSGLAPQAPYTMWLGLAASLQASLRPPTVVKVNVDVPVVPPMVTLRGFVHPVGKATPIVDAKVVYVGAARPDLSTDATGHFGDDVPPGTYELEVRAPGYLPNRCGGTAVGRARKANSIATPWPPEPGQANVLLLDCPLEPAP